MYFIELFKMYKNGLPWDIFISRVKEAYVKDPICISPPDDIMILSSIMIIEEYNKEYQGYKQENTIALAGRIFKETGDIDAVLLLLSYVHSSHNNLRRILRTHKLSILIPFVRQELLRS